MNSWLAKKHYLFLPVPSVFIVEILGHIASIYLDNDFTKKT